jgi:Spy/CpxP family protein refolding chaperone
MKIPLIRFAAAPILASGMLMAQAPAPPAPAQPPAQHRQWQRGQMFDRMAAKLNLTDAQKGQAKSIWQSARESSRPVAQQLRQAHVALRQAAKAGKPAAEIDQLAANAGQLTGQLAAVHTKAFEQFYAMLTPEQRTTADQLGNHFHGMFMGGHAHAPGAGAGS